MNLHAFYHFETIGNTLLVRLGDGHTTHYLKKENLVVLKQDERTIGYNLLNASMYIDCLNDGQIKINPEFVESFNKVLKDYNEPLVESDYDDKIVIGCVKKMEVHPDSDHMHICQVNIGNEELQIVCGAHNVKENEYVVVAKVGAVMPNGLLIQASKLRGIDSYGMLCSARELNLPNAPQVRGILLLDKDKYEVGKHFF